MTCEVHALSCEYEGFFSCGTNLLSGGVSTFSAEFVVLRLGPPLFFLFLLRLQPHPRPFLFRRAMVHLDLHTGIYLLADFVATDDDALEGRGGSTWWIEVDFEQAFVQVRYVGVFLPDRSPRFRDGAKVVFL
jgi:hypothetical protein